jgi:hypothetical protein
MSVGTVLRWLKLQSLVSRFRAIGARKDSQSREPGEKLTAIVSAAPATRFGSRLER